MREDPLTSAPPAYEVYEVKTPSSTRSSEDPVPSFVSSSTATASLYSGASAKKRSHPVARSDRQLYRLAAETSEKINWNNIMHNAESGASRWKWQENNRDFTVYMKQQSTNFAVLAVGVVPASVPELARVLHASTAEQHLQKMQAYYGDQFKDGALVYNVDMTSDRLLPVKDGGMETDIADLAVKTATFHKSSWLHSHEQWCYLDALHRHDSGDVFEKHMATLHPKDLVVGKSDGRTKYFHDVVTAYRVKAEDPKTSTGSLAPDSMQLSRSQAQPVQLARVQFYAEFTPPGATVFPLPVPGSSATDKTIKQRLLKMAHNCERLTQLVRRRRLGMQILVDEKRIFPPTNTRCFCCSTSLLLAKLCQICGQGVCSNCSVKHERETQVRGHSRMRLETVRVCDLCMERVDKSNYAHLGDSSLMGPTVFPNPPNAPSAASTLKQLLRDALINAPTEEKKASVMTVIKCVVDQASAEASGSDSRAPLTSFISSHTLTSSSPMSQYLSALDYLEVEQVPYSEAPVSAASDGRSYVVNPSNPNRQMDYPVPENEEERLKAIEDCKIKEIGQSDELSIICDLAAKELDTFASMVTIVTEGEQQVIATNVADLENAKFPRAEAFCSHTIMEDKPLLIPHPEADVRFHQCGPVKELGTKYYCGFPLVADDNKTVIGALCCIDTKSHDMTESQYAALQKLAQTASKVVRIQGAQRRSSVAMAEGSKVQL